MLLHHQYHITWDTLLPVLHSSVTQDQVEGSWLSVDILYVSNSYVVFESVQLTLSEYTYIADGLL